MSDRKLVVFGSNSFSGQDFIDHVLDNSDFSVIGVSRSAENSPLFLKYKSNAGANRVNFARLDMNNDMGEILDLLDREKPGHIVNFAAQSEVAPSWEHPEHWFETNTVALSKLVNHLRKQDYLEKYLHISSPEAYGSCEGRVTEDTPDNPSTPYAASKAAADMILRSYQVQYGFPAVFVRATNVYGARQQLFKMIPRSVIQFRRGNSVQLHGGGVAEKSYIHIRDVSDGEFRILTRGRVGQMYHLSPDQAISIKDLVTRIAGMMEVSVDDCVENVGERPGQDARYWLDSTLAREELGWQPNISLESGLAEVRDWVGGNWDKILQEPLEYIHKP